MDLPIVDPRDPRDRFVKPPFPQKKQTGSGNASALDPPAAMVKRAIRDTAVWKVAQPSSPARTAELVGRLRYVSPRKVLTFYSPF